MISFCEERFPTDVSYGISGGPSFHTEIVETAIGHEYRNIRSPYGRNRYNIASGIKTKKQLDKVVAFFRAMKGRAIAFRFKDWLDFEAEQQFIAISDGKLRQYQLVKSYEIGTIAEVKKISKPVKDSVKIYVDGNLYRRARIDDLGLISLYKPLPKGVTITADFEFDVPVRFDTDQISASIESYGVHSMREIPLIEVNL
jgi:uncharacterized protein (TIGR02217 family)